MDVNAFWEKVMEAAKAKTGPLASSDDTLQRIGAAEDVLVNGYTQAQAVEKWGLSLYAIGASVRAISAA